MDNRMDEELMRARHGWEVFTRFVTVSVLASAAVLGLMALFLL